MKILTGDIIEAYHRKYLSAEDLSAWAMELLEVGIDSEAVVSVAVSSDLPPERVPIYLKSILKELKITDELDKDILSIKKKVFLAEYREGLRPGGSVLQKFDDLRIEIGFPDMVGFTILGDDYKGSYKSGYHTIDRKLYGEELEIKIRTYLEKAGKL